MGKLVRDNIPAIMIDAGKEPKTRLLEPDAYVAALMDKLSEEAQELATASPADRLEEAADVYEVLLAILGLSRQTVEDLLCAADQKRTQRGGFSQRIWLET